MPDSRSHRGPHPEDRDLFAPGAWPAIQEAVLADDVDTLLVQSSAVIASADSGVLDRCRRWCNLAYEVIQRRITAAYVVPMCGSG